MADIIQFNETAETETEGLKAVSGPSNYIKFGAFMILVAAMAYATVYITVNIDTVFGDIVTAAMPVDGR